MPGLPAAFLPLARRRHVGRKILGGSLISWHRLGGPHRTARQR